MESRIKKILGKVRAWYGDYKDYRRGKRLARVRKLAKRRSKDEVQIMEYGGEMYICYRGVPIVRASEVDLGCPWEYVLKSSRAVYQDWLIERELEKRNIENRLLDK